MNKNIKIFFAYFFLLLFVQAVFPEYIIHELTGHHDTIDNPLTTSTTVSSQHIHCDCLEDQLPVYNITLSILHNTFPVLLFNKIIQPKLFAGILFQFYFPKRGPPSVI